MKKAAFTIVAKNYIGLARVLEQSFKENSDADFFIFIADEFESGNKPIDSNILVAKDVLHFTALQWSDMSFKYSLVEFCTAIKPACFQFLFDEEKYEKAIYFDPDIFLFSNIEEIYSELDNCDIVLTPHILSAQTPFKGDYADYLFLVNGTFNLGFIGLKKSETATRMLNWWQHRLMDECFFDNERGMATDQKWMNMLPALFTVKELHILRHAGYNVAPWNYHERKLVDEGGKLYVVNRDSNEIPFKNPLIFVHFSGYDYRSFLQNKISHKAEDATIYSDTEIIFEKYANALQNADFDTYINLPYSYNTFKNGKVINSLQRRIYRRLKNEQYELGDPFQVNEGSFYDGLKKRRLVDNSLISSDKISNKSVQGFDKKLGKVNWFFRLIKTLVGVRRYSIMIRFFRRYFREENQAFLYDKSFNKKLW